jgi:signal transduction histidine kinase
MATLPQEPAQTEPYLISMTPASPTPVHGIVEALRSIAPLAGLTDEEYRWLAEHGKERVGGAGALMFREGEPACNMNFLLQGEIYVRRRHGGPMALFIGRAGQMTGMLPFSRMKGYGGDGFTNGPVWVLDIPLELFPEMLAAIPSMAQRCVSVLLDRVREVTRMEQQAEKLMALGKLAANLAHELNNPASAAQRSAASLFEDLREYGDNKYSLGSMCLSPEISSRLQEWVIRTRAEMAEHPIAGSEENPLGNADREAQLLVWLEAHKVARAWEIAPSIAETRFPLTYLDEFAEQFPDEVLAPAMASFASSIRVERMTETIIASTARIFDLISAIKDYSYMDQAPIQEVDLAQSLESTLSMFGSRLAGVSVETKFASDVPTLSVYGSELNQVWTELIENAIDAMPDGGRLRLTTRLAGQVVVVEFWDSGKGIAEDQKSHIFEPFFTTKAPGSGLGLGLDTAQRIVSKHSGFLTVHSKPGETCFEVRLPLGQAEAY